MINLLHFADAGTPDGVAAEATGAGAYPRLQRPGGQDGGGPRWPGHLDGPAEHVRIGDRAANDWDLVALVSYPSRAAFIDMVTSPTYEAAHAHVSAGSTARCSWPASRS